MSFESMIQAYEEAIVKIKKDSKKDSQKDK